MEVRLRSNVNKGSRIMSGCLLIGGPYCSDAFRGYDGRFALSYVQHSDNRLPDKRTLAVYGGNRSEGHTSLAGVSDRRIRELSCLSGRS
jgi:hypothetical protein